MLWKQKAKKGCCHSISAWRCFRGKRCTGLLRFSRAAEATERLTVAFWHLAWKCPYWSKCWLLYLKGEEKRENKKIIQLKSLTKGDHTAQSLASKHDHTSWSYYYILSSWLPGDCLSGLQIMPLTRKQRSWYCIKSTEARQDLSGMEQCHTETRSQLKVGTTPEL